MSLASLRPDAVKPTTNGGGHAKPLPGRRVLRQCALILPDTGRRCGSVALRSQQFCRHHAENHLPLTGERQLCERLDRLTKKMDGMDIPQLLEFLRAKLITLQKTLRRFPEVAHTLTYSLDRLEAAKSPKSITSKLPQQNQKLTPQHQAILNKIRYLQSKSLESII